MPPTVEQNIARLEALRSETLVLQLGSFQRRFDRLPEFLAACDALKRSVRDARPRSNVAGIARYQLRPAIEKAFARTAGPKDVAAIDRALARIRLAWAAERTRGNAAAGLACG